METIMYTIILISGAYYNGDKQYQYYAKELGTNKLVNYMTTDTNHLCKGDTLRFSMQEVEFEAFKDLK